jgi:hypothetical protein
MQTQIVMAKTNRDMSSKVLKDGAHKFENHLYKSHNSSKSWRAKEFGSE